MKSLTLTLLTAIAALPSLTAAATATNTATEIPKSTDASSFLSDEFTTVPTWATGKYATTLASALYSVVTSFAEADKYTSVTGAIDSAAQNYGGDAVMSSIKASGWNWGDITTNSWYTAHVPKDVQKEVSKYDVAWASAYTSVEAAAISTSSSKGVAAAGLPRCTGMAQVAGVAAGVAVAVAGVM